MKRYLLTFLILFAPEIVVSAPNITGVSTTLVNGSSVTISGTGFGATGPNVVLFDTFEKGSSGANISTATNSADVANWTTSTRMGDTVPKYTNAYALSGTKSMAIDYRVGYGSGPSLTYSNVQNSDIIVSWWQYIPTNRDVPGTNNSADGGPNWKQFWIGDQNDDWPWGSDYSIQCLSADCSSATTLGALDDTGAPARFEGGWYTPLFSKGTWMRVTVAMRNATSGGYAWQQEINGISQLIAENATNVVTAHSNDPWNVLVIPGFGRKDNNSVLYIDDVYVATGAGARARVEMGNASTYSASTKLAFITPTAWSNTSITATVRSGPFTAGSAYLYVVDASGVVNTAGYPITVGGSSTITCYQDADNDLYGHGVSETVESCSSGYYIASHFTALTGDCNDSASTGAGINPGAYDTPCDGIDQDCSGSDYCLLRTKIGTGSTKIGSGITLIQKE